MTDEAIIPAQVGEIATQKYTEDDLAIATKSGDWLPRLQLMTSNSKLCKSGKFPVNHYAVIDSSTTKDMGVEVDVLVIAWRPKALEMGEMVISVFDTKSSEFLRIQEKAGQKDSGCMSGVEFLIWIPASKMFVTFFMGTKTSKRDAPALVARLKMAATLKSKEITSPKYSWFTPVIAPCSTPMDPPDMEDLAAELDKFNNPPATLTEKPDMNAADERAR
jgi:hypothetical protein